MKLDLSRVIIFTASLTEMVAFYRDVIGLTPANNEDGWVELGSGSCGVALHAWDGDAPEGPIKIVFFADDVAKARELLNGRGADFGEVVSFGAIDLCDGRDPDGNAVQISSRPPVDQSR